MGGRTLKKKLQFYTFRLKNQNKSNMHKRRTRNDGK